VVVKKLIEKYHPLVFVKWIYLCGFFIVLPFGFTEVLEINWQSMPLNIWVSILFVVIFTTFFAYILNLIALQKLKATTVSSFIYLQPVVATVYALITKSDTIDVVKIIAASCIFLGVYLVSKPPKQTVKSKMRNIKN
jgi:drug/metabolite transporter (DMT)-like permease